MGEACPFLILWLPFLTKCLRDRVELVAVRHVGLVRDVGGAGSFLDAEGVSLPPAGEHTGVHVPGAAEAHERVQQPGAGRLEHAARRRGRVTASLRTDCALYTFHLFTSPGGLVAYFDERSMICKYSEEHKLPCLTFRAIVIRTVKKSNQKAPRALGCTINRTCKHILLLWYLLEKKRIRHKIGLIFLSSLSLGNALHVSVWRRPWYFYSLQTARAVTKSHV